MKDLFTSIRVYLVLTAVLGLMYPAVVTLVGQLVFREKANGEIIYRNGIAIGSKLIAQKTQADDLFWPRPSAVDYNTLASGGSNLGPTSLDLAKLVNERRVKLRVGSENDLPIPDDLVFASGSGLDPHISPAAARFQIARVAHARHLDAEKLKALVERSIEHRELGVFGEPKVNVLELNLRITENHL